MRVKISSDNPAILAWPREALWNEEGGYFVTQQCRMERQLNAIEDTVLPPGKQPEDRLNVLYIIARLDGENDVGFQTLARPLIDFAEKNGWPMHIDVLRPPTFDRLRAVLQEKPDFYHIVHFDGHGGYGAFPTAEEVPGFHPRKGRFAAPAGALIFETENDQHPEELVSAEMLSALLREHRVPVMVLNACQSAMLDERAESPFASVAASLMRAGIRGVTAMSYSLYVSGAEVFVPSFYSRLFETGNIGEAMRAGRKEMFRNALRDTPYGKAPFQDWIVPVLYRQADENTLPRLTKGAERTRKLPPEALETGDFGFIGRDSDILKLERALRREPAGILIHGMAGERKTTLAKGFLRWLESTGGLSAGAFWFSFEDIHGAGYIIDPLTAAFFGANAMALPTEEKLNAVTAALRKTPLILVWDNFESALGIPGTEVSALLQDEDRMLLKRLLKSLRGGKTKVLITSRSPESWLTPQECYRLPLSGLRGEELWRYCNAVVADLGLALNRNDAHYRALMEKLEGNPLAVRAILLRLKERPAAALLAELEEGFRGQRDDEGTWRIQAALGVFEKGLNRAFAPALRLIGLHEHYVDADMVKDMLSVVAEGNTPTDECFAALESAGLCAHKGNNLYQTHPALRSCLARLHPAREADQRAFVDLMGMLADHYTPKELHEQRTFFTLFGANLHRALRLARALGMQEDVFALTQALATYALNIRNFIEAEKMFQTLAEAAKMYKDIGYEVGAYHQLGIASQEMRDFDAAEGWYQKALEIELKRGDEQDASITCHQLGRVSQERRDFAAAERWYQKSLETMLKLGDEQGAAMTYHQLGMVSQERRDFGAAERWYLKSLEIKLKLVDEFDAASTFHNLGAVLQEQQDFVAAERWYQKSLEIELKLGDEQGAASTYHQLGTLSRERRDFATAERWYLKSLEIKLKLGNEHGAASTYNQLGNLAVKRRDFATAENWFQKALDIFERFNDSYNAEGIKHNLNLLSKEKEENK